MTNPRWDFLCQRHRRTVLDTGVWPDGVSCDECAPGVGGPLLPHLDRRTQLSIHEAGHIVAFLRAGIGVKYAALFPDRTGVGSSHIEIDHPTPPLEGLLSGGAAVAHWARSLGPVSDDDLIDIACGSRHDHAYALRRGDSLASLMVARVHADRSVRTYWDAITRVAAEMRAWGWISAERIAVAAGVGRCP